MQRLIVFLIIFIMNLFANDNNATILNDCSVYKANNMNFLTKATSDDAFSDRYEKISKQFNIMYRECLKANKEHKIYNGFRKRDSIDKK